MAANFATELAWTDFDAIAPIVHSTGGRAV